MASRATIEAQFTGDPGFRGASGAFDPFIFQRALQDSGYTVDAFYAQTGRDVARRQMLTAFINGITPPPGLTRLLFDFYSELRTIEYLVVTPEEAGSVPEPTAADLETFHMAHANDMFSSPEYRSFDYITIRPDEVAMEIEVSDADIRAEYDANKAQYDVAEQRDVEQIVFPDKAAADAAAARIKTPEDFAAVARERGLSAEDLKLGTFAAERDGSEVGGSGLQGCRRRVQRRPCRARSAGSSCARPASCPGRPRPSKRSSPRSGPI